MLECREKEEEEGKEEAKIHFHLLVMKRTVRADGGMPTPLKSVKKWVRDAIFNSKKEQEKSKSKKAVIEQKNNGSRRGIFLSVHVGGK